MAYEVKIGKSYSLYPTHIEWLEKRAETETERTGRKVSASEILTDIISTAVDQTEHVEKIRVRIEPRIKQVAK